MKWLFWKEYRQNRLIVFTMLAMLIIPYLFGLVAIWKWALASPVYQLRYDYMLGAAMYSLIISQLSIALIGGNVIAGERVDRSAEFQAYLPIERKEILTAKILLALAIAALIWLTNVIIMWYMWDPLQARINPRITLSQPLINVAVTGLAMFCVAWLCSATIKSPTIATFAGLLTPLVIWSLIYYVTYLIEDQNHVGRWPDSLWDLLEYIYRGLCLTIGPICFGLGSWLYLRRVEP